MAPSYIETEFKVICPLVSTIGCEGRISHLKHRFDLHRTRIDELTGARIWCGYGIYAHNLTKITTLAAANS